MQIVIEIDDELYEEILSRKYSKTKLEKAVADGKPLLKGHGRLIDANALYNDLEFPTKQFAEAFKEILNDAPTVIGVDVPGICVGKMAESEYKE